MGFETRQAGVWLSALEYNRHLISEPWFSIVEVIIIIPVIIVIFIIPTIIIIIIINYPFTALFQRLS